MQQSKRDSLTAAQVMQSISPTRGLLTSMIPRMGCEIAVCKPSPHSVNSAQNNLGINTNYKGVFLNQGYPGWNPPLYSVAAPSTATISNIESAFFIKWAGQYATFQDSFALQTPLVFTGGNATASALYKAHLGSSSALATGPNTQRKIVRDSGGKYHAVYESAGQIWYTRSTDGGTTWSPELKLGEYENEGEQRSPAIAFKENAPDASARVCIVWEAYAVDVSYHELWYCELSVGENVEVLYRSIIYDAIWFESESAHAPVVGVAHFTNQLQSPGEGSGSLETGDYYYPMVLWYDPAYGAVRAKVRKYFFYVWSGTTELFPGVTQYTISPFSSHDEEWDIAYISNDTLYYAAAFINQSGFPQLAVNEFVSSGDLSTDVRNPSIASVDGNVGVSWDLDAWEFACGAVRYSQRVGTDKWSAPVGWMPPYNVLYQKSSLTASIDHPQVTIAMQTENNGLYHVQGQLDDWHDAAHFATGAQPAACVGIAEGATELILSRGTTAPYAIHQHEINAPYQRSQRWGPNTSSTHGRGGTLHMRDGSLRLAVLTAQAGETPLIFSTASDTTVVRTQSQFESALTTEPFAGTGMLKLRLLFTSNGRVQPETKFRMLLLDAETGAVLITLRTFMFGHDTLLRVESPLDYGGRQLRLAMRPIGLGQAKRFTLERWLVDDVEPQKPLAKSSGAISGVLPGVFAVHDNYPNPFNPSTQIKFDLPEDGFVALNVFDVLGRKVGEIVNGNYAAGFHSTTWNAVNLASGVYFLRFAARDGNGIIKFSKMSKLVLTK